jgi:hypothetical protein
MPTPQVKSSPWQKAGKPRRQRKLRVWPGWFWKQIIDAGCGFFTPQVLTMIGDMNERMYGKR